MFARRNRSLEVRGRTTRALLGILCSVVGTSARAQVLTYEADIFPEQAGWQRLPAGPPQGERWLEDGWFIQTLRLPEGWPEPIGEGNSFRRELDWAVGIDRFFVEWRAVTDNPDWIIDEGHVPTVVAAGGRAESLYHTVMSESAAALFRDPIFPLVFAEISVGVPHTYRVEVFPNLYIWYVDGIIIDMGIPEGPYPDPDAAIVWGARREYVDASTAWDYVRAGRIPDPGTADFDGDTAVTFVDYYYVAECLANEGPGIVGGPGNKAGPGCTFTDFDGDSDVDLLDFAEVQNIYFGFECEPECFLAPERGALRDE